MPGIVSLPGQGAASTPAAAPTGFPQWESDLLSALGAPVTTTNLQALNYWAQSEGSVTNNALATSGQGAGATKCVAQCGSSSPIYEYATEAEGVAQMAHFLGGSNYTAIVRAFQTNAGLPAIYQAINNSKWCSGCQNGKYPEALAAAVGGHAPSVATGVGTGSGSGTSAGGGSSGGSSALSTCVISFPGFLFFSGPCILTKGGVKWLSGALALVVGAGVGVFAVTILASAAFKGSGAQGAATKIAGLIPGPEAKIATTLASKAGSSGGSSSRPRAPRTPQAPSAPQIPTAGRRESRGIERQYRSATEQQGPIGPRGGNPTSTRIAQRERRGTSVPGPRRREPPNVRGGGPF